MINLTPLSLIVRNCMKALSLITLLTLSPKLLEDLIEVN